MKISTDMSKALKKVLKMSILWHKTHDNIFKIRLRVFTHR